MPRRKSAWYEFTSTMPTAADLRPDPVKTLADKIEDVKINFKSRRIKDNEAIGELNKLYIAHILPGKDVDAISAEHKVMLHYAFMILSGERDKIERRKAIVIGYLNR